MNAGEVFPFCPMGAATTCLATIQNLSASYNQCCVAPEKSRSRRGRSEGAALSDLFGEVRRRVSAQDAARQYGVTFDRRGWALCPFHDDRHASMSFKDGRFRCWVCNVGGDAIDLTGRLFGLDAMGAVRRLNADFGLALPLDRQPTREEQRAARHRQEIADAHRAFEEWRGGFIRQLNAAFRVAHIALQRGEPFTEQEAAAIRMQATVEYYADELTGGTAEAQAQIYRGREVISKWIEPILSD